MADYFFNLGQDDQREGLEYVRARTGRPTHLLEKDVWVVWTLRALFESPLSADLTFKGVRRVRSQRTNPEPRADSYSLVLPDLPSCRCHRGI